MIETRLTVCVRELAAWLYKRELYQNFSNEEKVEVSRTCLTQARRMLAAETLRDAGAALFHASMPLKYDCFRQEYEGDRHTKAMEAMSAALALADGKEA